MARALSVIFNEVYRYGFQKTFKIIGFSRKFSVDQILSQISQVIFRGHKSSSGSLVRSIYSRFVSALVKPDGFHDLFKDRGRRT